MNGLQSPHKLLNEYLERHITCLPDDTGDPFTSDEPDLFIDVQVRGFEWERLQLGMLCHPTSSSSPLILSRFECNSGSSKDRAIALD